jgi:TRAP transporter TAXI family solute receptor
MFLIIESDITKPIHNNRIYKMRKPFTIIRLSLILAGTLTLGMPVTSTAKPLQTGNICTGPTTGTYYQYADGLIEAAKETLGLDLENVSTVGSLENAKGIVSGKCDLAIVQADLYIPSGTDFHTTPESKLFSANKGSVAALYPEIVHILVNRDSGISSIADLAGKKVNLGEKDSGTFLTAHKVLNLYNQLASTPVYSYEASAEAVAKVAAGTLDATFYVASAPISALAKLPADANVTLIPATLTDFAFDYTVSNIPATTYPWLTHEIKNNIAVWSLLTVGPTFDRTQLKGFLDTLYANKDAYADKYHAKWALLDKAASVANLKTTPINGWDYEAFHYFANASVPTVKPQSYFCSASPQGIYTKVAQDLLPIIKSTLGISLTEKHTVGSLDNMIKLYNGECAMMLVQGDAGGYALSVDQNTQGIAKEVLMAIFAGILMPLYGEEIHIVVNTGSGIESSLDLAGKKVNMGQQLSGSFVSAMTMLLLNNIKPENVIRSYDSPEAALPKVISGEYDAMFVTGKAPIPYLVAADCPTPQKVPGCTAGDPKTLPIKLVPVKSVELLPKTTLSANHYPWQQVDIPDLPLAQAMFAFSSNLSLDSKRVADLMNAIYALKTGDTTLSPTWDETSFEQGLAHFNKVPTFFSWPAAQYFADKME